MSGLITLGIGGGGTITHLITSGLDIGTVQPGRPVTFTLRMQISPTMTLRTNPTPAADLRANPSPTVEGSTP